MTLCLHFLSDVIVWCKYEAGRRNAPDSWYKEPTVSNDLFVFKNVKIYNTHFHPLGEYQNSYNALLKT
jgi:hypothetical protein